MFWPQVAPGGFRLDIRKDFFTGGVVKHWNGLVEVGMFKPFLGVFKQ